MLNLILQNKNPSIISVNLNVENLYKWMNKYPLLVRFLRVPCIERYVKSNSLHPNISLYILYTVLYTFPKVLTRRIC